jgi:hypothetical protein
MPCNACRSGVHEKKMCVEPSALADVNRHNAGYSCIGYRLNLEFQREWDGQYYAVQQVAPVVAEEAHRFVVITVYTFYF